MGFLRDMMRRLLMLVIFAVLFSCCLYLWDSAGTAPEPLTEMQNALDLRREICSRLYDQIRQSQQELEAVPFYRVDWRIAKQAEIRSRELLYNEAQQQYRAARIALEKARTEAAEKSVNHWQKYGIPALWTGMTAFFLLPLLVKILLYYLAAPLVGSLPPVRLKEMAEAGGEILHFTPGATALDVELAPGTSLLLRSGDWGTKRSGVLARTRFMWSWKYPVVSFAAGLCELVELSPEEGRPGIVTVTSPEPDFFVAKIDLNGAGVVIRPRFLAGVSGDVKIRPRWSFHLHNLLSGRLRQIVLSGHGFLLVTGAWGVEFSSLADGQEWRIEDGLLLGYSTDAEYALCRTETFWHYLRGNAALFDRRMKKGMFFTQNNRGDFRKKNGSFLERTANALLNGIGGLLGF